MIRRHLEPKLKQLAKQYPVITLMGPRQSGKTTLAKACFKKHSYHSLEDIDSREMAEHDPKEFLNRSDYMIIDEIQRVPQLVSYIQGIVDNHDRAGQFILTGSHQLQLTNAVSQSLAGRTAVVNLLPFSMSELNEKTDLSTLLYRGFYPRIIDKDLNPTEALSFYTSTYIERDVREIKEIKNLSQFERFVKLCASNVGQLLNKNRMGNDIGVDAKTIDSWLSVLQASYLIYLLPPHYSNFRKRLVKSPKLYFYDVGLASFLLGIKSTEHIDSHPLKGELFENLVIMEKLKQQFNQVQRSSLYFFRDSTGNEIDLLEEDGLDVNSYEIKLSSTLAKHQFKGLDFYKKLNPNNENSTLLYTGDKSGSGYGHQYQSIFNYLTKT